MYCRLWRWDPSYGDNPQEAKAYRKGTPIVVVSWTSGRLGLRIRAFTVVAAKPDVVSQFLFGNSNWHTVSGPVVNYLPRSMIASCRNTAPETAPASPICLFFQPQEGRTISLRVIPADNSATSNALASSIRYPSGIPQSRGAAPEPEQGDDAENGGTSSSVQLKEEISRLKGELHLAEKRLDEANEEINKLKGDVDVGVHGTNNTDEDADLADLTDRIN